MYYVFVNNILVSCLKVKFMSKKDFQIGSFVVIR